MWFKYRLSPKLHIIVCLNIQSLVGQIKQMDEAILDYDDMFTGIKAEILKSIFIRYYTMQDYFQFAPSQFIEPSTTSTMQIQVPDPQAKSMGVFMYYNRVISECVSDLHIMNKLINVKAKSVNTLLDNGRSIATKKNSSWNEFINEPGFEKVKQAYQLLSPVRKNILKYAILSISNLELKLSINMSKVSVIPLQKFLTFQCLKIPVLSVVFLQYLQCKLFKSKVLTQQSKVTFLRQFPKVTFIKINQNKNNTELQLLQNSQQEFITKQVPHPVKNLQFIQINERSLDPILPHFERKTKYEHFYNFDLQKITGGTVKAPFRFQIVELMRQLVLPLVKDFKPDLIIFMESYPSGVVVMDDQPRGLILCEMAEVTCVNKMYVFKEMGPQKSFIKQYVQKNQGGQKINIQNYKLFEVQQMKIYQKFNQKFLLKPDDKKNIEKLKKVFMNQLCYTSLALIQKTSFENALHGANIQFFKREFLQGIQREQTQLIRKNKDSNEGLTKNLISQRQIVKLLLENEQSRRNKNFQKGLSMLGAISKQNVFKDFYDLQSQRVQQLKAETQTSIKKYFYKETDNFIVKYYDSQNRLLVIIIKYLKNQSEDFIEITFLSKTGNMKMLKQEVVLKLGPEENYLEGATYICSNDYIYRGFGKFRKDKPNSKIDQAENYNKAIHRLQINPVIGKDWELVDSTGSFLKSNGKEEPKTELEKKTHGYGLYDADNKTIIMMGGHIDTYNEEKISKTLYLIKGADIFNGKEASKKIYMMGKTNKVVFRGAQNIKTMFLHPFIFGIPFASTANGAKGDALILNSNGYYLNLNHANKIFTSNFKLSHVMSYEGINIQNKLEVSEELQSASMSIFFADLLIKCMVYFPNQINVRAHQCCLQTLEQGNILIYANDKNLSIQAPLIFDDNQWRQVQFR